MNRFLIGCLLTACSSAPSATDGGMNDAALKANIGEACPNGTSDCMPDLQCAGEDPGGGQCFKPCTPSVDSTCGDTTKYACSFEGHCYLRCTLTTDCPRASQGYVCKDDTPPRPPVKFCDVP